MLVIYIYGVWVVGYWFRTEYCWEQLVGRSADGLYRSGIGFSALFFANSVKMAGTEIDGGESSSMLSEEEERREGDWNEVINRTRRESGRKRKKAQTAASGSNNDGRNGERGQNNGVINMVVRFEEEGGVKKFDPLKLTQIIQRQVGEVRYARVLGDGNLLIGCNTEEEVEKVKKLASVGKVKISRVVQVGEKRFSGCKGVVFGISLNVSMKVLMENLKVRTNSVKNVRRLTAGVEKRETEGIVIEFEGELLPKEVYLGFMKYNIREFVPKPMRCFNCQEFGHVARMCKRKRRCARCGGDHEYGKCGEGVKPRCCNCGGSHSVAYWGCEVLKREVEVQQIRVRGKVSYAEAVKMAGQKRQVEGEGGREIEVVKQQQEKQKVWREKKNLVTFIAGVINATCEIKSKTERIQIIVKAAEHHLGMRGLKWEEVNDELRVQSGQEVPCLS